MSQNDVAIAGTHDKDETGAEADGASLLVLIGVAAFVISLVAFAPAALIRPLIDPYAPLLTYERLDGSFWRGAVKRLSVDDLDFGDVTYSINPLSLLMGRASVHLAVNGSAATGQGRVSINPFKGEFDVRNADLDFELSSIKRYSLFGIPYQGNIRGSVGAFSWSPRQGCARAQGSIWTDALDGPMRQLGEDGIEFAGPFACNQEDVELRLAGSSSSGDVDITISVAPDLTYNLAVGVRSTKLDAADTLRAIGFEEKNGRLVYDAYGPLRGLGS